MNGNVGVIFKTNNDVLDFCDKLEEKKIEYIKVDRDMKNFDGT